MSEHNKSVNMKFYLVGGIVVTGLLLSVFLTQAFTWQQSSNSHRESLLLGPQWRYLLLLMSLLVFLSRKCLNAFKQLQMKLNS